MYSLFLRLSPLFLLSAFGLYGAAPGWWSTKGATDTALTADDYTPANLGQLKNFAKSAYEHLDDVFPSGWDSAGFGLHIKNQLNSFTVKTADNYTPINLGQLKAVAYPYYKLLLTVGYDTNQELIGQGYPSSWVYFLPWNPKTPKNQNYFPANLGQMKAIFSFDLSGQTLINPNLASSDSDSDELPDAWELLFGITDPTFDSDGDFISNLDEYNNFTNPILRDNPAVTFKAYTPNHF